jgi:hypothetical protein
MHPQLTGEERGLPKPQPQRPVASNPSTPGVQKPPNRPGGRDVPPAREIRSSKWEGYPDRAGMSHDALMSVVHKYYPPAPGHLPQAPRRVRDLPAVQQRPRERRARRVARAGARAGPDDPSEPEPPPARPRLTRAERDYLKAEVDRRRRALLATDRITRRQLFTAIAEEQGVEMTA